MMGTSRSVPVNIELSTGNLKFQDCAAGSVVVDVREFFFEFSDHPVAGAVVRGK